MFEVQIVFGALNIGSCNFPSITIQSFTGYRLVSRNLNVMKLPKMRI